MRFPDIISLFRMFSEYFPDEVALWKLNDDATKTQSLTILADNHLRFL